MTVEEALREALQWALDEGGWRLPYQSYPTPIPPAVEWPGGSNYAKINEVYLDSLRPSRRLERDKMTEDLIDMVQRNIYIRDDGAIVWESILEKYIEPDGLERILNLVGDHVFESSASGHRVEGIDWTGIWRNFNA